jgi:hypothetical protein
VPITIYKTVKISGAGGAYKLFILPTEKHFACLALRIVTLASIFLVGTEKESLKKHKDITSHMVENQYQGRYLVGNRRECI